jgi:hypothetical protein
MRQACDRLFEIPQALGAAKASETRLGSLAD